MRLNKLFIVTALAIVAFLAMPSVARANTETNLGYDGNYALHFTPDAATIQTGAKEFDDTAVVEGDVINLEVFCPMGFAPMVSAIDMVGSTMTLDVSSVARGSIHSTFQFVNGKIKGNMVWTREDGRIWKFAFVQTN
jgi:hypothetical protein